MTGRSRSTVGDISFSAYRPGIIAKLVGLHALYYSEHWNFGAVFEAKVARELSEFVVDHDPAADLFLCAWRGPEFLGSITIDRTITGSDGAHLRWFIVSDKARGTGLGRQLMARAISFAGERNYDPVWLTTFAGLDAARHLYESFGFRLTDEQEDDQWKGGVREQRFERHLRGNDD